MFTKLQGLLYYFPENFRCNLTNYKSENSSVSSLHHLFDSENFRFLFFYDKKLSLAWGSKGGAVVRALASHQCGPGQNPGVDAICGLSLLLVLSLAPKGFSSGTPVFPSP